MANIAFGYPIEFNPYSSSNFDPTTLINDPTVEHVTRAPDQWVIRKSLPVPGFGNGVVTLTIRPAAGSSFTYPEGATSIPTGVVDSVTASGSIGLDVQILSITALASLNLQAAQITSAGLLFTLADTFSGSVGNDLFNTGLGADTLNGNNGNDTLLAGGGSDTLNGGAGDDVLSGDGVGAVASNTPGAADTLNGGAGRDALYGGTGSGFDVFVFSAATDSAYGYDGGNNRYNGDVIYDYQPGIDKIDLTAVAGRVILTRLGNNTIIDLDTDGDGLGETGEGQIIVYNTFVVGDDLLVGTRGITSYGRSGADTMFGTNGVDTLAGFAGSDDFLGGRGGDFIYLGAGDGVRDNVNFLEAEDSAYSLADAAGISADKIYNFVSGTDKLVFEEIEGQKTALISTLNGDSFVYIDVGNDGVYDLTVIVVGATVVQGDLVLPPLFGDEEAEAAPAVPLLLQYGGAWGQDLVSDNGFGYWKPEVMQLLPDDAFGHWVVGN